MLDRTGDTDCEVYVRTNSLTSLSNLKIFRLPTGIYNCTRAAYGTANSLSKVIKKLEVLCASNSTATGNKDLCIHDISYVGYCLNDLKNLNVLVVRSEARVELDNFCFSASLTVKLLHNAWTYCSHLRTEFRASDCSDRVAAECRTGHKELTMFLLFTRHSYEREISDIKLCAVCCKTCMDTCANTRAKVTTDCCSTD